MAELYWMALTRDVPFSQYGEDEATVEAAGISQIYAFPSCNVWKNSANPYLEIAIS